MSKRKHPKIWIAPWHTESSDRGVEGYWTKEPSPDELDAYFLEKHPYEHVCYCEHNGGYKEGVDCNECMTTIYWHVVELKPLDG